jgi:3-deoxy-manno-octulosonate cytidylyltransferase (CMP-KDO synthetase)
LSAIIIIPSRYQSTRLPAKPLCTIAGRKLVERVWKIATAIQGVDDIVVATDHPDISDAVTAFGGRAVMTPEECRNGTERALAAVEALKIKPDIIVNMQGDAPVTPPWVVQAMVDGMKADPKAGLCTPAVRLSGAALEKFLAEKKVTPTSGTTVVMDKDGYAMYFSKAVIPYPRGDAQVFRHIGLYAYRYDTLKQMTVLPESPLEKIEKLEQLRALENGIRIRVVEVDYRGHSHASVDTPEDVSRVEAIIAAEGELVPW